jgi:glucosamine-phosphate N-acetyltransferase
MTQPLIREMYLSDMDSGFFEALDALSPSNLTSADAQMAFTRRLIADVKTYVALNENGSRVIGTASLFIEPKFIHGGGLVGHIEDVSVRADLQHSGIGAALVNHLLDVCRAEGCYKVILDCEPHNVPFYEKIGFRLWEQAMRIDLQ